jgi:hypothetical protein
MTCALVLVQALYFLRRASSSIGSLLSKSFELFEGFGPVGSEEAGEGVVGEDLAAGLADGAVVGFVVCEADALDGGRAAGAREVEAAVDGHFGAEGGDFLGEADGGFGVEAGYPCFQSGAGGGVEAVELGESKLAGLGDGGELGGVEDLVGVGVADAGEDAGVGEGAFEGAVFGDESGGEGVEGEGEDVEAAGVQCGEGFFALDEVERGAALGAGFGEGEGAVGEVEGG